jgi:hypothetical protein
MTPRTPQCEVFWALLSNSEHSGVPEDSKSPTLEVLGFTPTLGQSGVATLPFISNEGFLSNCVDVFLPTLKSESSILLLSNLPTSLLQPFSLAIDVATLT